MKTVLQATAAS